MTDRQLNDHRTHSPNPFDAVELAPEPYYVWGEDFVSGLVGPFATEELAKAHIEFQRQRGDASVVVHNNAKVMLERDARKTWAWEHGNVWTPKTDIAEL